MLTFAQNFNRMALNIKNAIKEKGITSKELAERLNISKVTLSTQINGNPTIDTLEKIAKALECDVIDLFDQKPDSGSFIAMVKDGKDMYSATSLDELKKIITAIEIRHSEG